MKIHILGPGTVGGATASLFRRFGHEVLFTDRGDDHAAVRAHFHMVCTPEAVAPSVVRELAGIPDSEVVVIRSSVPPGTTAALSKELRRPILHCPEFLRAATAEQDVIEAKYAIVGSGDAPYEGLHLLRDLYVDCGKEVIIALSTETELWKLVSNSYLATLISFFNEVATIADAYGVNSHHMARLMVRNDPRISPYGALRHGAPYGGHCLPKDILQLRVAAQAVLPGVNESGVPSTPLLDAVSLVNNMAITRESRKG